MSKYYVGIGENDCEEMDMNIRVSRGWTANDIIDMCIRHGWYDNGYNEDFNSMLCFVRTHKPVLSNMIKVAVDIKNHTVWDEWGDENDVEILENIMYDIERTVKTWYNIEI